MPAMTGMTLRSAPVVRAEFVFDPRVRWVAGDVGPAYRAVARAGELAEHPATTSINALAKTTAVARHRVAALIFGTVTIDHRSFRSATGAGYKRLPSARFALTDRSP
jgi:hypothetical protein